MVRTSSWNQYKYQGSGNHLLFGAVHPILQLHDIEVLVWGEHALLVVVELEAGVLDLLDKLLLLLVALGQTSQNLPHRGYCQRRHPRRETTWKGFKVQTKLPASTLSAAADLPHFQELDQTETYLTFSCSQLLLHFSG